MMITFGQYYHPSSKQIHAASGIKPTGEAHIVLYIPAIMDECPCDQATIVQKIMHERDHLTEIMKNEVGNFNAVKEAHFHALTTEFVTVPLKEKYNVVLSYNYRRHYEAWVKSGKTEKSFYWQSYIHSLMESVLK